jgi:radical SAM protein with 4Fe4S-binding SPASM domain
MHYFLTRESVIKWLEKPCLYHIKQDELYELDKESLEFLLGCASENGCSSMDKEFIDYCLTEGILTTDKTSLKRPPVIHSPVPSLRYLELQITDMCNLRCRHCYIGDRDGRKLSLIQIRCLLEEFEELQGLRVLITGGEPLLHSRFNEINDMLSDFSLRKILFTNGLLLTEQILNKLNVDEIQFSIDGLDDAHNAIRGNGTCGQTMEAIKRSIDKGFDVSVATMVHAGNLGDFDAMERLFRKLGIREWTVDVPCITGRLSKNNDFQVSPEQGGKYLGYGYGDGLHSGAPGFGCGLHLMAVMADGRIAKCTFYGDRSVGSVEDGLRECWQRIDPVNLGDLKCDCEHIESCRGGCRYRAELLGDQKGKDLYRCSLYDIIKK